MVTSPRVGPRKGGFWGREFKVINMIMVVRTLNDHLTYRDVWDDGGADWALEWAAVIQLSKSGRAVGRGVVGF